MMQHLTPARIAAPGSPPVSLEELKAHVRVEFDDDDALLQACLDAAVSHLDGWSGALGRALVTQTWRFDYGAFFDALRIDLDPVQSVSVTYVDSLGAVQTLAPASYHLVRDAAGPVIVPSDGASWPTTAIRPDAVRVSAVCGYGDPAAVPGAIKAAIKLIAGDLYANREAQQAATLTVNGTVQALLAPFRRVWS